MSAPVPFRTGLGGILLATFLLLPLRALAWPVDLVFPLESGADRFHKLTAVEWVDVEDPSVASVELLSGSNELLITGKRPGRTLMLLYAEGKMGVWRLVVTAPGVRPTPEAAPELLAAARKVCPGLQVNEGAERSLVVSVKDSACRKALLDLFRTDAWLARELEVTFELPVLQEQLSALSPRLKELGLEARYSGAGIILQGKASPDAHRRALWELFRQSVGRVPLEDRVTIDAPEATPDAGTEPVDAGLVPVEAAEKPVKRKRGAPAK
ncbi:pilus assembly protein N-terminal domain-containing protein [Hyalangium versicolor]|uniref:pilus assembly protein N-terminal domain-containing protein n=1 Tax=Hyalangium versicolor TaxID=2861190 RepID=UPI001CCC883E|nr:pilus assembly protein N-terminal domain-containing protein [Hyalangium versicolor]